ncbi:hypothetical protein MSMEG_1750 [Mycolicibacterium smegmatis MC2 155]|uniref:Uncharacterized protein n=1 Tax=Mycolicibacterium smegmatis (strain ATCC 700084 / mc(2)155) TaxID=246196 RepID=A0QT83_MYCS2|nr:hypothetical protein MSMEG_1750 [Mycolicibacterium smegmatis MC2 155]
MPTSSRDNGPRCWYRQDTGSAPVPATMNPRWSVVSWYPASTSPTSRCTRDGEGHRAPRGAGYEPSSASWGTAGAIPSIQAAGDPVVGMTIVV